MLENIIDNLLSLVQFTPDAPLMFNSGFFIYFFFFVVLGYNFVKTKSINWRNFYLMVVSFYFYYKSSGVYLGVLAFISLMDFLVARGIASSDDRRKRRGLLLVSLVVNLGMLCYFKYTNFVFSSISNLFNGHFEPFDIFLPIGISFFTFQSMSYTIDVFNGKIEPLRHYTNYAFYVSFFPQLVAGPIVRASDFIPQLLSKVTVTNDMIGRGMFLIICGLFKKVVISDYISINFVDRIFDSPALYTGFENLIGVYGYSLQIYCDFSGYSDMAIGLALLLGFRFNVNFDSPYCSVSISEFWRRWHISLSSWLKDYLYISLGGNRKGKVRTYFNLLLTMLLGGLWHGASVQFILWGAWHGVLLVVDKWRKEYFKFKIENRLVRSVTQISMIVFTFHLVCIGWVFFRADSLETVGLVFKQIGSGINVSLIGQFVTGYLPVVSLIVIGYLLHFMPQRIVERCIVAYIAIPNYVKAVLFALFVYCLVQVRSSDILPFIYFQF